MGVLTQILFVQITLDVEAIDTDFVCADFEVWAWGLGDLVSWEVGELGGW